MLTNLANIALVGPTNNQEAAASLHVAQKMEWRQLARGRRDVSKVKQQPMAPYQPRIMCTVAEKRGAYELRTQKPQAEGGGNGSRKSSGRHRALAYQLG